MPGPGGRGLGRGHGDVVFSVDSSPLGSFVHRIFHARILKGLPLASPGDFPDPWIKHGSPALQAFSLPSEPPGKPHAERGVLSSGNSKKQG